MNHANIYQRVQNVEISSLHEAKNQSPIESDWAINKMLSLDQGTALTKTITSGNATVISNGSFKQYIYIQQRVSSMLTTIYNREYILYTIHQAIK